MATARIAGPGLWTGGVVWNRGLGGLENKRSTGLGCSVKENVTDLKRGIKVRHVDAHQKPPSDF